MDWTFSLVGLGVGLLVGVTGIGGGALMTPVLVLGFGVPAALVAGAGHLALGNADLPLLGALLVGSLPG